MSNRRTGFLALVVSFLLASSACSLLNSPTITPLPPAGTDAGSASAGSLKPTTQPQAASESTHPPDDSNIPPINSVLHPTGPWFLLQTDDALLALNPDGTGPVFLASISNWIGAINLENMVSPSGARLAYLTANDAATLDSLTLNILSLPDLQTYEAARLIAPEYTPDPSAEWGDPVLMAARTLVDVSSFAWSPDGSTLAFMGMIDGETSDLYLHNPETRKTIRLTDGPSNGIRPSWSPDGRWIVHTGVSSLGTGAGFGMEGIWAASADGSIVRSLYPIDEASGDEILYGWLSPSEFVVSSWSAVYGEQNMRVYNIETGETKMIIDHPFTSAELDSHMGTVLYYVDRYSAVDPEDSGLFLVHISTGTRTILNDEPLRFTWDSSSGSYLIITENRSYSMTPMGSETDFPNEIKVIPSFQPGSDRWAAAQADPADPGVWAAAADGTIVRLSDLPYSGITWTTEGILIMYGNPGAAFTSSSLESLTTISSEPLLFTSSAWLSGLAE